jgi:uncharacterized membrane protein
MIDKSKLIDLEWKTVRDYLKKDNPESLKLAIIEAENIFLRTVERKGYKARNVEEKISLALKEMSRPEVFLKNREIALNLKNKVGQGIEDPYSGLEIVNIYKESISEILFGIIDEKKFESLKLRFWRFYYLFFMNKKKVYRFLIWILLFILLMLFIADTDLGKNLFDLIIDKIHLIIRIILFTLFIAFAIVFFITLSIVLLESRSKKKYSRRSAPVDK